MAIILILIPTITLRFWWTRRIFLKIYDFLDWFILISSYSLSSSILIVDNLPFRFPFFTFTSYSGIAPRLLNFPIIINRYFLAKSPFILSSSILLSDPWLLDIGYLWFNIHFRVFLFFKLYIMVFDQHILDFGLECLLHDINFFFIFWDIVVRVHNFLFEFYLLFFDLFFGFNDCNGSFTAFSNGCITLDFLSFFKFLVEFIDLVDGKFHAGALAESFISVWLPLFSKLISFLFVFLGKFMSIWTWSSWLWSFSLFWASQVFFLFLSGINWIRVHEYTWIHFQFHSSLNHHLSLSRHFYLILNLKLISCHRWLSFCVWLIILMLAKRGAIAFDSDWNLLRLIKVS